jgi:hypothetical protein
MLRKEKKAGLTFIIPKSKIWREVLIDGTSKPVYLNFVNLECGANVDQKVERFLHEYGFDIEIEKPSPASMRSFPIQVLLGSSRKSRVEMGRLIDGAREGLFDCSEIPGPANWRIEVDLATGELVVETRSLYNFVLLQVADVFSRGQTITNCEQCGAYMTPSRNTKAYCSDACRQKAHRAK